MKLTPELKFIQEKLVLAAHPWLSLEEALKMEIWNWCLCYHKYLKNYQTIIEVIDDKNLRMKWYDLFTQPNEIEIIWLPPTLSRVLRALEQFKWVEEMLTYNFNFSSTSGERISRKLLNDDWSEMTLFEQSNETISAIARELWYNSLQS